MDDQLWESLYWTRDLTRPDRLAKVINTIFRKNATDGKHFIYDSQAAKNAHKLDLTQHDINRLEQLDKLLGTYSRASASSNSHESSSKGSGGIGFGGFRLGGSGSKNSHSQSQQSEDLQTVNDTMHEKKIDENRLNATKIEIHNDSQYALSRDDVQAYLSELSNHVHLEGEIIRPKPIDVHLVKLSTLRAETKLLSHSVLVRTRSNVHVLPLRCPPQENRRGANNVTSQYRWLADKVDQLQETVENLTNSLVELKKQVSGHMAKVENWTSETDMFKKTMTAFQNNTVQQQTQLSNQLLHLTQLGTQTSNEQKQFSTSILTLTQLGKQIAELQRTTSKQHTELVNRAKALEGKLASSANAGNY